MIARLRLERAAVGLAITALAAYALAGPLEAQRTTAGIAVVALGLIGIAAYVVWNTEPVYTLCAALAGSMFSGNWEQLGVPGVLAPDRLLLLATIGIVLLRAPIAARRTALPMRPVHWLMVVLILYTIGSALAAGTLSDRGSAFEILQNVGVLPFLVFFVAPAVFTAERHRRVLLITLVGMGGYLGVIAALEAVRAVSLIFPSYITDPSVGIHFERARGPFVEAVTNGTGLFAGAVAAVMALATFTRPWQRVASASVVVLCALGMLATQTRSIWLGATVATLGTLLVVRELRRWLLPVVGATVAVVALAFVAIPDLRTAVEDRRANLTTVYDRTNLNVAAINMLEASPLVGFGWGTFATESLAYFEQSPNIPLTGETVNIHNLFLTYAAELGLVGLTLWALIVLMGIGGALLRAPPELRLWRIGLGAYVVFFLIVSNAVFPQAFPSLLLWVSAGVLVAGARANDEPSSEEPSRDEPPVPAYMT